jgi:hypothetical protein
MKTIDRILELAKRQEKSRKSNGNGFQHNRRTQEYLGECTRGSLTRFGVFMLT